MYMCKFREKIVCVRKHTFGVKRDPECLMCQTFDDNKEDKENFAKWQAQFSAGGCCGGKRPS